MGSVPFESIDLTSELVAAPIQPQWITAGTPVARNAILSRSADGSTYTMVWDCTAGAFDWTYDCDETVYILHGSILLTDAGNPVRRLSAGQAVFFPKGAKVSWVVEGYVRKLAVMRNTLPAPVAIWFKAMRRLRRVAAAAVRLKRGGTTRAALPAAGSITPSIG